MSAEPARTEYGPLPHGHCIEGGCEWQHRGEIRCDWDECRLGMSDLGPASPLPEGEQQQ